MLKQIQHFHLINASNWGDCIQVDGVCYEKTYSNIIGIGEDLAKKILSDKKSYTKKTIKCASKLYSIERKRMFKQLNDYFDTPALQDENTSIMEKVSLLTHKLVYLLEKEINYSTFK